VIDPPLDRPIEKKTKGILMPQTTAAAEQITFELLEQMIQTRFEGKSDTLKQTIENAVQVCVAAVSRHAKPGSVTIKLDFTPEDDGQIDIFADVDTKLPRPKPLPVRLYGNKRGELYANDPDYVHPAGMFEKTSARVIEGGDKKKEGG
jgi:hypothetical protein